MDKYIKVQQIDEKIDFVNLAITLSNVDSKCRDDMELVCESANFNIENLTSNIQIHSDIVNKIDENNIGIKLEGDALITNVVNVPLLIFTADCVPIAIIDKKNKAIGLAHAGWRGTFERIAKKTIEKMNKYYNTNSNDLVCIIGPSIGPCCYEVSKELIEKFNMNFTNSTEKFYTIEWDKYKLDLWKVNELILKECGVKDENIINLNLCTSCNSDKFHSYRKHNQTPKRIGTILQIK
ncbi:peptidoglycan editing factor PgeF [Romboutsia sp. 13368]|uniref:peptidoglycan editing factor PgeF n=1 Tax=Romboutsia sp. 13368 TaxID=2708053 RepID=UPI0025FB714C|nr:peptidoglycan editing factor PgeF [Romboutsia sp. 13368]